jgi:hypothetical protein
LFELCLRKDVYIIPIRWPLLPSLHNSELPTYWSLLLVSFYRRTNELQHFSFGHTYSDSGLKYSWKYSWQKQAKSTTSVQGQSALIYVGRTRDWPDIETLVRYIHMYMHSTDAHEFLSSVCTTNEYIGTFLQDCCLLGT